MGEPVQFDAIYDDAVIESAMTTSVREWYAQYGFVLTTACAVNYAGFAIYVALVGFKFPLITAPIVALILLAPFYFTWSYFRSGRLYAKAYIRMLVPSARVSVDSSGISVAGKTRSVSRRWSEVDDIIEHPEYFFLRGSRYSRIGQIIAKKGAPEEALLLIRDAMRRYGGRAKYSPNVRYGSVAVLN